MSDRFARTTKKTCESTPFPPLWIEQKILKMGVPVCVLKIGQLVKTLWTLQYKDDACSSSLVQAELAGNLKTIIKLLFFAFI
jgi:hypothetical protein